MKYWFPSNLIHSTTLAAPAPVPEQPMLYHKYFKHIRQPTKPAPPPAKTTGGLKNFNLLGLDRKKFGNAWERGWQAPGFLGGPVIRSITWEWIRNHPHDKIAQQRCFVVFFGLVLHEFLCCLSSAHAHTFQCLGLLSVRVYFRGKSFLSSYQDVKKIT